MRTMFYQSGAASKICLTRRTRCIRRRIVDEVRRDEEKAERRRLREDLDYDSESDDDADEEEAEKDKELTTRSSRS